MILIDSLIIEALEQLGFSEDDYFSLTKNFTPQKLAHYLHLAYAVGFDDGMKEERNKHSNNMKKSVIQFDFKMNELNRFDSCGEAAKSVNRAKSALILSIKKGSKCAGYFWKYA